MDLETYVARVLDTQNDPPRDLNRADYLEEAVEHIGRVIYHDEDNFEDFFEEED